MRFAALSTVLILLGLCCSVSYAASPAKKKKPSRAEKKVLKKEQLQKAKAQVAKFEQMKKEGADMISNTKEAAALRSYELRKKKTRGIIRKREKPISSILFPGMAPEEYNKNELVPINVLVYDFSCSSDTMELKLSHTERMSIVRLLVHPYLLSAARSDGDRGPHVGHSYCRKNGRRWSFRRP